MKKGLFSVITLLLSLTCSIACFACIGVSDFDDSTSDSSVVEEHTHEFDGIVVTTNPTKLVYTAKETFDITGIQVSKRCTLEGCEGEEITEGVTFEYEKEGATYLTGDMTKVVIKALDYTTDLAITVNKIEVDLPEVEDVEYTGSAITATVPDSDLYDVTENIGGTAVGEYEVKLTLKDSVNYKFKDVEGAVATVKYNVTKISNTVTLEDVAAINCGGTPALSATALQDAVISYVYSTAEDGEYTATIEGGFVEGTYYVKALAAETDSYKATYSAAKSFTVAHKLASWNTEGADEDVALCKCGATLTEKFRKKVTADRQDVVLTATTSAIVLTGVSDYASVKSVKYGEISLGTNIANLDKTAEALADAVHGEQNLTVVVVDSYGLDHTITVPVTIVTDSFATVEAIIANIGYHVPESGKTHEGKYYTLAGNISYTGSYACYKQGTTDAIGGQYSGNGFAGTFDGRNYTITGGNFYGGGLFGALSGATVKNIKFAQVNPVGCNRTLIAASIWNSVLENIEINTYTATITDPGIYFGVISSGHCVNSTLKDITINMGNSVVPWIFGKGFGNTDAGSLTFDNVSIKAKSVGCLTMHSNTGVKLYFGDVSGVKFNFSGTVIDAPADEIIDPKETGWFFDLTEPWSKFGDLKAVTLVCGETQVDITDYAEHVAEGSSNGIGFTNLSEYITEDMYNKSATLKIEFDVGEDSVAKFDYKVGIGDVYVAVTLNKARQDVILADSAGAKTTFTLDLGDYGAEDCTLTKVMYGSVALDVTEDGKVTITDALKNAMHGEANLLAVVSKGRTVYSITVPVTIVTASITTFDELSNYVTYTSSMNPSNSGTDKYREGKYYILANDITAEYFSKSDMHWASEGRGFAGTFDGRGHSISGGEMYHGGVFGAIEGGTIKNVKFTDIKMKDGNARVLIAGTIRNATIENVEIKIVDNKDVTADGDTTAIFAIYPAKNVTLKDVKVDAAGSKLKWLFGHHSYFSSAASNYICTNLEVIATSIECFTSGSNGRLYFNQVPGVKFNFSGTVIDAPADTEIDPKAENFEFALSDPWSKFTAVKSASIVLGDNAPVVLEVSDISITTDGKLKFSGIKDQLTTGMYNETVTLKIEFDVGEDNVAKFDYKVSVGDVNVEAKLTDRQDVILKDSTGAKTTFTLNLGDYAGGTLGDVRCGTNALEKAADGSIKTDALQNVTHGETNLTAVVTKDGVVYTLTVPVTIVTETFSNVRTIIDTIGYKSAKSGETHKGKYYTLAQDVSNDGNGFNTETDAQTSGDGFAGTFDGRNHTISNGNFYKGGLFGALSGATIKNINFTQINAVDVTSYRTLIAASVHNSTLENIKITTYTLSGGYDGTTFGVIASGHCSGVKMKNVTINMGESEIPWIFGYGWGNASASFTCENVVINLKSLKCLTMNSNGDGLMLANNAVPGITVNESSKTEG